ncbi:MULTISPECIES: response regulator [unclassified Methylobacterium]|uniref:response regulator n=1 Tax=unclassified Methylobacterium TaxID=2615210 RepID=UPI00226A26EE|nr:MULTISPECIES: response regulator [unclassified Methylobacterium]
MRILVLEDDPMLSDGLTSGLSLHGMSVECVSTCSDAVSIFDATHYSAAILDLMLPDGSGLDVLSHIRARDNTMPVMILTAIDAVADRIAGLDRGADDYMGKPFDLGELAARLRVMIRRAAGRANPIFTWRDLTIALSHRSVTRAGIVLSLSRREFAVLEALIERPGRVLSRSQLEARLYGWNEEIGSNALEVHVHNLRAKIGRDAIETVRGLGYRIREDRA